MQDQKTAGTESKNRTENSGFSGIVEAENEDPSFFITEQRREHSSEHYPHLYSPLDGRRLKSLLPLSNSD